jgi:WD40 repeat protein
VVELDSGDIVSSVAVATAGNQDAYVRGLSPDGSLLAYGARPVQVRDTATGDIISSFAAEGGEFGEVRFSAAGDVIYTTARDAALRATDPRTGTEIFRLPAAGSGVISVGQDGLLMVADPNTMSALLVDTGPRGEIGAIRTCDGFVAATSLEIVDDTAVLANDCPDGGFATVMDLRTRGVVARHPGQIAQALVLSPDGRRFARQELIDDLSISPIRIRDVQTGELVVELDGVCEWLQTQDKAEAPGCRPFPDTPFAMENFDLEWSPDGRWLAANDVYDGFIAVWEAATGALVHTAAPPDDFMFSLRFSAGSDQLVAGTNGGRIVVFSTETWAIEQEIPLDSAPGVTTNTGLAGFTADGSTMVVVGGLGSAGGGGWLHRIDTSTWTLIGSNAAHDGSPKSVSMSPDGSLVATGASDGIVRVWDARTGELLHQVTVDGQAQGLAFVDDTHLAIAPHAGHVYIETIDRQELLEIVAGSLSRGLTEGECARFNFGDDCPTLEELRSGS